jgi:hypothetical protein
MHPRLEAEAVEAGRRLDPSDGAGLGILDDDR